jgi:hypothetical protein
MEMGFCVFCFGNNYRIECGIRNFTCCTASTGAIGTVYTSFISEADVDRVDTTEETLLLSNLQAETEKL